MEQTHASIALFWCALVMFLAGALIAGITTSVSDNTRKSILGPVFMAVSLVIGGVGLWVFKEPPTLVAMIGGGILILIGSVLALRFGWGYADPKY